MNIDDFSENIVLIGMPGAGKSTVGIILAKLASRDFVDTDVIIQAHQHCRLQKIIDEQGLEAFMRIEEKCVLGMDSRGAVVATGGSVVYSDPAMRHLREHGVVVHLDLPYHLLISRFTDLETRGVVRRTAQTMQELYDERAELYARYADLRIDCTHLDQEQVAREILREVEAWPGRG